MGQAHAHLHSPILYYVEIIQDVTLFNSYFLKFCLSKKKISFFLYLFTQIMLVLMHGYLFCSVD